MEKEIAESLMHELLELGKPLNATSEIIEQIVDKEERAKFRRGIGELMGRVYIDLMVPIIKQYPELDPDRK